MELCVHSGKFRVQIILLFCCCQWMPGVSTSNLFDFGADIGDTELESVDDGSSTPINLPTPIQFYGMPQTTLYVNTNGILSFQSPFTEYRPRMFPLQNSTSFIPLIAPFWDDVNIGRFGNILYRMTSNVTLLQRARDQLQELFLSSGDFTPTTLFIATWDRVAPLRGGSQANTFQVVIAADQQMTFVFFIYGDIQWGSGANIGFDAGDGTGRSFMVPGALTNQTLNIDEGSNVGVRGVYIYRVDCSVLNDFPLSALTTPTVCTAPSTTAPSTTAPSTTASSTAASSTTALSDNTTAIIGGVVAVVAVVVVMAFIIIVIVILVANHRRTKPSTIHQDVRKKQSHVAIPGDEHVTTTHCEAYVADHVYEDIQVYQNPVHEDIYEIPDREPATTPCPAYTSTMQ